MVVAIQLSRNSGEHMVSNRLKKTEKRAIKLLWKNANDRNDPEAQFEIGWMYAIGSKTVLDKGKSFYWCKRATDQGYRKCLCELGYKYFVGDYIETDISKALRLFGKTALLRDDKVFYNLALIY